LRIVAAHVDPGAIHGVDPLHHEQSGGSGILHSHHRAPTYPGRRSDEKAVIRLEGGEHAVAGYPDPVEPPGAQDHQGDGDAYQSRHRYRPGRASREATTPDLGRVTLTLHPHQGASSMSIVARLLSLADGWSEPQTIYAHCDLPCGVYDPAQARIEAESVKGIMEKFNASDDNVFKTRAVFIKEERADLVKHHLWVLWTDYFKPTHLEAYPQLHELFWNATKTAGEAKKTNDVAVANNLLTQIAEIDRIFWETKK
jgi:nickel superoxide dismutase